MSAPNTAKAELVAIYRLEFYRNQKNWKLCDQVRKNASKQPPSTPKAALNRTYIVDTPTPGRTTLNEAFIDSQSATTPNKRKPTKIPRRQRRRSDKSKKPSRLEPVTPSEPELTVPQPANLPEHSGDQEDKDSVKTLDSGLPVDQTRGHQYKLEQFIKQCCLLEPELAEHLTASGQDHEEPELATCQDDICELPEFDWAESGCGPVAWAKAWPEQRQVDAGVSHEGSPEPGCGHVWTTSHLISELAGITGIQELDPDDQDLVPLEYMEVEVPLGGEDWCHAADTDGNDVWDCEEEPLPCDARSCGDSTQEFMRGAHGAPHSSEIDVTTESVSRGRVAVARGRLLARAAPRRDSGQRTRSQKSLDSDLTPHYDPNSYDEFPTRDLGLRPLDNESFSTDVLLAGSHRNHEGFVIGSDSNREGFVKGSHNNREGVVLETYSNRDVVIGSRSNHEGFVVGSRCNREGFVVGSHNNREAFVVGSHSNREVVIGSDNNREGMIIGSHSNHQGFVIGSRSNREEVAVGFSSHLEAIVIGSHRNRERFVTGSHNNREGFVTGYHSNREGHVIGSHCNHERFVTGSHNNHEWSHNNQEGLVTGSYNNQNGFVTGSRSNLESLVIGSHRNREVVIGSHSNHAGFVTGSHSNREGYVPGSREKGLGVRETPGRGRGQRLQDLAVVLKRGRVEL